jgi:transposase
MKESWMTDPLPHLRQLAVLQVIEECKPPAEIAESFGVSLRSVQRWRRAWERDGTAGLRTRPRSGRPQKLTVNQAAQVLRWLEQSPADFGFPTERWTAPRVAELIRRRFAVQMNHRYLNAWLSARRITPQIPDRVPRERDEALIHWWVAHEWPRLKKMPARTTQTSFLPMKVDF